MLNTQMELVKLIWLMMKRKVFAAVMTAGMAMGNIQPALAYT